MGRDIDAEKMVSDNCKYLCKLISSKSKQINDEKITKGIRKAITYIDNSEGGDIIELMKNESAHNWMSTSFMSNEDLIDNIDVLAPNKDIAQAIKDIMEANLFSETEINNIIRTLTSIVKLAIIYYHKNFFEQIFCIKSNTTINIKPLIEAWKIKV